jgi:hypothetical protein
MYEKHWFRFPRQYRIIVVSSGLSFVSSSDLLCRARRRTRDFSEIYFPSAGFPQPATTPKNRSWQSEIPDISAWTTHLHMPATANCRYRNSRTTLA